MRLKIRSSMFCLVITILLGMLAADSRAGKIDLLEKSARERAGAAEYVKYLTDTIGRRVGGSESAVRASRWAEKEFRKMGLENVHLEECADFENEEFGGTIYNVVGDITGAESPDEYVILGAHIDCAPFGTGATDNASGAGAVMEAARLLIEAGVKPRRTIRFILFGGEEVGLLGSKAYVRDHPDILGKISAVYNMDMGSNYISGLSVTGPMMDDMRRVFEPVRHIGEDFDFRLTEVDYLQRVVTDCCGIGPSGGKTVKGTPGFKFQACGGAASSCAGEGFDPEAAGISMREVKVTDSNGDTLTLKLGLPAGIEDDVLESIIKNIDVDEVSRHRNERLGQPGTETMMTRIGMALGSSDHAPFLNEGIPAFSWEQKGDPDFPYPLHSDGDVYEAVDPEYLERSALIMSIAALGTADLEGMISRERLMKS